MNVTAVKHLFLQRWRFIFSEKFHFRPFINEKRQTHSSVRKIRDECRGGDIVVIVFGSFVEAERLLDLFFEIFHTRSSRNEPSISKQMNVTAVKKHLRLFSRNFVETRLLKCREANCSYDTNYPSALREHQQVKHKGARV